MVPLRDTVRFTIREAPTLRDFRSGWTMPWAAPRLPEEVRGSMDPTGHHHTYRPPGRQTTATGDGYGRRFLNQNRRGDNTKSPERCDSMATARRGPEGANGLIWLGADMGAYSESPCKAEAHRTTARGQTATRGYAGRGTTTPARKAVGRSDVATSPT